MFARRRVKILLACTVGVLCFESLQGAGGESPDDAQVATVVRQAFRDVHDGYSTDEVIVRDDLNAAFLAKCRQSLPDADAATLNWTLLTLRKAGKLDVATTKRVNQRHDDYRHAAEIAARLLYDRHGVSIDRVMCDPRLRAEFDAVARQVAPTVDTYRLRKAALGLRKARRLRPELVLRVAAWDKQVSTFSAGELKAHPEKVPEDPGIYIFRDTSGYLYIGESANLRQRLTKHLDQSDRASLARYLKDAGIDAVTVEIHAFDPESDARSLPMRRAYESELIRSRKPRFNVAP